MPNSGRSAEEMALVRAMRQEKLSPERRSAIARRATLARWSRVKGPELTRANAMLRELGLMFMSARKDGDLARANRISSTMLQWEKHRHLMVVSAPKREWWREYVPTKVLGAETQKRLRKERPYDRYVHVSELSPEEVRAVATALLDRKFEAGFGGEFETISNLEQLVERQKIGDWPSL